MQLGQGCRKRSPWWCWAIVMLLGLVVLPGRSLSEADEAREELTSLAAEAEAETDDKSLEEVERWLLGTPSANSDQRKSVPGEECESRLQQILDQWDQTARKRKRVTASLRRFLYDLESETEYHSDVELIYAEPDQYRIVEFSADVPLGAKGNRKTPNGQPFSKGATVPTIWINNGKQVARVQSDGTTLHDAHAPARGDRLFDNMPFGFPLKHLFGPAVKEAREHYQIWLLPDRSDSKVDWLCVHPKRAEDRKIWQEAIIILDRATFLPKAIKVVNAFEACEVVYVFEKIEVNGHWKSDLFDISRVTEKDLISSITPRVRSSQISSAGQPAALLIAANREPVEFDRRITVSFDNIPLKQAIEQICRAGKLEVMCFEEELAEDGIVLTDRVTFSSENESAIQVLKDLLKPYKLGLEFRKLSADQPVVIEIRSQEFLDRLQLTVVYPVGDLLKHDKSLQSAVGVPLLDKIPDQSKLFKSRPKTQSELAETLIEILEKALAWDHSEANTAAGSMKFRESSEALVISCNQTQHNLIVQLLGERRKACGLALHPATVDVGQNGFAPVREPSPRTVSNPAAYEQIETVQLRIVGPERSQLTIDVADRQQTRHRLALPGRQNLAAGQIYSLTLEQGLEREKKSDQSESHWTLEIPEIIPRSGAYLIHNSVPLALTDEDLTQVTANNSVTKVVYLPHPSKQDELAIASVETLVSTRLDPGLDVVEEAKKRGTILAVLRSHQGKLMFGMGVNSDTGVTGTIVIDDDDAGPPPPTEQPRTWNELRDSRRKAESPTAAEAKSTQPENKNRFVTIIYPVADLVVPVPGTTESSTKQRSRSDWGTPIYGTPHSIPGPPANWPSHKSWPSPVVPTNDAQAKPETTPSDSEVLSDNDRPACDASPIIELLTQTLKAAYDREPPEGTSMAFMQETLSLVVRATQNDHDIIAQLLTDLRCKQDLQVTVDCKIVTFTADLPDTFWEWIGLDFDFTNVNSMAAPLRPRTAEAFLKAVRESAEADLLAFPKLTVFNGIGAQIQISRVLEDEQHVENMNYMIVPTISADRRSIDVKFAVNPTSSIDVLSKAKSMTIPDGQSVLIEITDELLASPKRSGIPEVDKALRELKKRELGVRTFVLLTPRIIIQEEEEELLGLPE